MSGHSSPQSPSAEPEPPVTQGAAAVAAMAPFTGAIRQWFLNSYASPTAVQLASWPVIAAGRHALITAPTGSGKTLTAFLWSIDGFLAGRLERGATRVLYISPLKALNNDIRRNLLTPLEELGADAGPQAIRVGVRSGDTDSSERQRLLRKPPEILITTPESLNILLTTAKGQLALNGVETVILDEIHAVLDSRRGVQLLTALEHLEHLCGPVQRIALSATVHPLDAVARYVGGRDADGAARTMEIIAPASDKAIELSVRFPAAARDIGASGGAIWDPLADSFREHIERNRSTLFFTNSRRLAEKVAYKLNEDEAEPIAFAHHGSLARGIRHDVEQRMKAGEIRAIVATSSLEMGIDIGSLDEVVMVQAPPSVASGLQRLGRAGHQVGATTVGSLYPTHAHDCLEAAVLAAGVDQRSLEPVQLLHNPLDVLAQVILSACAFEPWHRDALYALVCRAGPYHDLPRRAFDDVVQMLAGRYRGVRLAALRPRIDWNEETDTLTATRGAIMALYLSGGSIPERGLYQLRHADAGTLIGELDEEFVWEASVGQRFNLGTQSWQITRIDKNEVLVRQTDQAASLPPFWRADDLNRNAAFSERINDFLANAERLLTDENGSEHLRDDLMNGLRFDAVAAEELVEYLVRQRQHTNAALPHRDHLLIEHTRTAPGGYTGAGEMTQSVIHSLWGGSINRPWATALEAVLDQHRTAAVPVQLHVDNNCIIVQHDGSLDIEALLREVTADSLTPLLRKRLEGSGFFGAHFRQAAGRSLLLGRTSFQKRIPLWLIRQQAKKLLAEVRRFEDFPVLQETWRTCLKDQFDLPRLEAVLVALESGALRVTQVHTQTVSPFAGHAAFQQIMPYMYDDDTPLGGSTTSLSEAALELALTHQSERPAIDVTVIEDFECKRQRRAAGYAPQDATDALRFVEERVLLPERDWPLLDDVGPIADELILIVGAHRWLATRRQAQALIRLELAKAEQCYHTVLSRSGSGSESERFAPGSAAADLDGSSTRQIDDERSAVDVLHEVLAFYGPQSIDAVRSRVPRLDAGLEARLRDDPRVLRGTLRSDTKAESWVLADVYETLLRRQRAARRVSIEPLPIQAWTGLVLRWQHRTQLQDGSDAIDHLARTLDLLHGYPAPVSWWFGDLPASRASVDGAAAVQAALEQTGLGWRGCGREQVTVLEPQEATLLTINTTTRGPEPEPSGPNSRDALAPMFHDPTARYDFLTLADRYRDATGGSATECNAALWDAVWDGHVSTDTVVTLDRGATSSFQLTTPRRSPRLNRRAPMGLLKGWPGSWKLWPEDTQPQDELAVLDRSRDQARLLLERYGVVCREIANRDHPALRWREIFPALRLMELAGEVVTGLFIETLSGPQFADPQVLPYLRPESARSGRSTDGWISVLDPAAPAGLQGTDLLGAETPLPQRRPGNYLIIAAGQPVATVEAFGKRLCFWQAAAGQEDACVDQLVDLFRFLKRAELVSINGEHPSKSAWLERLRGRLHVTSDHRSFTIESLH